MSFQHTNADHPLENEYPKLIRDNIPQIIKQREGVDAEVRTLNDEEFLRNLLQKAVEEAQELSRADTDSNLKEEIADVYEVIDSLMALRGFSRSEIARIQDEKRKKRGGFEKRLLMLRKAS